MADQDIPLASILATQGGQGIPLASMAQHLMGNPNAGPGVNPVQAFLDWRQAGGLAGPGQSWLDRMGQATQSGNRQELIRLLSGFAGSTTPAAGYGRVIPGVFGERIIGGGGLNDPEGPRELANSIFQTNRGKMKGSLETIERMRGAIGRHPYNADELAITEGHLRDLATKPFVSQADQDALAEAAHDDAERASETASPSGSSPTLDFKSTTAKPKRPQSESNE